MCAVIDASRGELEMLITQIDEIGTALSLAVCLAVQ